MNTDLCLQPDALNAQFSHMTLAQQQQSESGATAPDARHYPTVYHPPPSSMVLQGAPPLQQQVASYMVAGHPGMLQGQPIALQTPGPNHAYPSSTSGPAAFPGSTLNQQLLQQHTYIQQPVQQVGTSKITLELLSECGNLSVGPVVQTRFMTNPSCHLLLWNAFKWDCWCVIQSLNSC